MPWQLAVLGRDTVYLGVYTPTNLGVFPAHHTAVSDFPLPLDTAQICNSNPSLRHGAKSQGCQAALALL